MTPPLPAVAVTGWLSAISFAIAFSFWWLRELAVDRGVQTVRAVRVPAPLGR
jgi:hypothetical protein